MKRQNYYPSRNAEQVIWLQNFAIKLAIYGPNLSIPTGDLGAAMDDARWAAYLLGLWLPAMRAFAPSTTDAVDDALMGEGPSVVTLPVITVPVVPGGVSPQKPGALKRIFEMVGEIKKDKAYTEAMGTDLGIVGPEESSEHPVPKFTAEMQQINGKQCVRLAFFKYSHTGVYIESRRNGGAWEFTGIDTVIFLRKRGQGLESNW